MSNGNPPRPSCKRFFPGIRKSSVKRKKRDNERNEKELNFSFVSLSLFFYSFSLLFNARIISVFVPWICKARSGKLLEFGFVSKNRIPRCSFCGANGDSGLNASAL